MGTLKVPFCENMHQASLKPSLCVSAVDPAVQVETATPRQSRESLKGKPAGQKGLQQLHPLSSQVGGNTPVQNRYCRHCIKTKDSQGRWWEGGVLTTKMPSNKADNGNEFLLCARHWAKHSVFIVLLIPQTQSSEVGASLQRNCFGWVKCLAQDHTTKRW